LRGGGMQLLVHGCCLPEAASRHHCVTVPAFAFVRAPAADSMYYSLCCPPFNDMPDAALDKAGVWAAPLAADSPLLSAATLAKLPACDAVPAAELAHTLLAHHRARLQPGEA
jgi:hypothetical protein